MEKAILTIKETNIQDVGKGIAKIDPLVFEKLKLSTGDVIKIQGTKTALAYVVKGKIEDTGMNVIRIDGGIRYNAGASIGEEVTIEKTNTLPAQTVNLSPVIDKNSKIELSEDIKAYIKERLINLNVIENNIVKIHGLPILTPDGYRDLQLLVTKTLPKGAVKITEDTKLIISEKAEEVFKASITYDDVGGLKKEIEAIREMVELPIKRPEIFKKLGISPPKGVLLYGPPGTGKTLLAKAVAGETDSHFITINGPEIVSGVYGKSEENLRNIFKEAEEKAPTIIFIDEIDAIAPKRENIYGETEKRIVAQLLTLMDGLNTRGNVVVIGATNIPDAVDPALRRPGRFDRELEIMVPDKEGRKEILLIHTRGMPLKDVNIDELVELTNGFSGADLNMLCKEAALKAIKRLMPKINKETGKHLSREIMDELVITHQDFLDALNLVEPSALREVQVEIPNVKWEDIGGLEEQKQQLKEMVEWPLKYGDVFKKIGITSPRGVLLYGPPGTGKTLLAKAVATNSNANFIPVKGPELLNKYVGESERRVREIFKKARQLAPSIIFFDEVDALTRTRFAGDTTNAENNVVAQILTEMDGISQLKDIIIIGATNRKDMIDPAFLRPGRFDILLPIPLPDEKTREKIFEVYLKKLNVEQNISAKELSKLTPEASGAEIEAICREAGMYAIRKIISEKEGKLKEEKNIKITKEDFKKAIDKILKKEKQTKEKGSQDKTNKSIV
ncbi:MAG TPA: CDC48 family AAA ATPase [archaeon]|jgi:transitional endoplasmic reticulum ATPase|nr:CDC48 family AAA ATPase [archaeon]HPC10104.1 CDC48 family AAA ATPase [archaeon]HRT02453.1 CDC48 family AAA ATPase [Candidatus Diapherotrites archaeon]